MTMTQRDSSTIVHRQGHFFSFINVLETGDQMRCTICLSTFMDFSRFGNISESESTQLNKLYYRALVIFRILMQES